MKVTVRISCAQTPPSGERGAYRNTFILNTTTSVTFVLKNLHPGRLISIGWDYVSELLPLTDMLLIPRWYEFGEGRWNDIDRRKQKNSEKNLSQCHFFHHKSHMHWTGRESVPPHWDAGDKPPESWYGLKNHRLRQVLTPRILGPMASTLIIIVI
jgi:hypothetical protein